MLEALLFPKTIAVVGASRTPGKVGHAILSNLIESGFEGTIIPVNPTTDEMLGLPCYPSATASGAKVDLGIIVVPTGAVIGAIENCVAAKARAICTITAGFREVGEAGAALESEIAALCKKHKVRMLGPNCLGLINTANGMNASFAAQMPIPGRISVVSQSGALCTSILDWSEGRGIGLAKLFSIGNKADLCETDLLEVLAEDDQTKGIACYLESIDAGDEFMKVAAAACAKKPVVVLKAGTTDAGGKAASSHTGSLAGADIAYGAAFKRSGIVRADNFQALLDYSMALSMQPLPKGDRVAIITNAGGPGIMAADAVENLGMQVVPHLSGRVELVYQAWAGTHTREKGVTCGL